MWELQNSEEDPRLSDLKRALEHTLEMKERGELRPRGNRGRRG